MLFRSTDGVSKAALNMGITELILGPELLVKKIHQELMAQTLLTLLPELPLQDLA